MASKPTSEYIKLTRRWTPPRHTAAELLAAGERPQEVFPKAKISKRTLMRWQTEEGFRRAVELLRQERMQQARDLLVAVQLDAVLTLHQVATGKVKGTIVTADGKVLEDVQVPVKNSDRVAAARALVDKGMPTGTDLNLNLTGISVAVQKPAEEPEGGAHDDLTDEDVWEVSVGLLAKKRAKRAGRDAPGAPSPPVADQEPRRRRKPRPRGPQAELALPEGETAEELPAEPKRTGRRPTSAKSSKTTSN